MLGGVTVNILLGVFIYMMVLFVWGTKTLSNEQIPDGLYVAEAMQDYGFQQGDHILAINGKKEENIINFKNRLNINVGLIMRDVRTVKVRHQDGSTETLSLPEDIGSQLFQKGALPPFSYLIEPVVEEVQPNSPAEEAGFKKGDRFVSVDGIEMGTSQEFNNYKAAHPDKDLKLVISHNGQLREVTIKTNEENLVGVLFETGILNAGDKNYSLGESVTAGFSFGYWTLHDYVAQFKYVFTKKGATKVGGFGAIGSLFPDEWHWKSFWMTTAFISIIIAFMNILPIPALDGGHVMFLLYEIIAGRSPNEKFLEYAQMVGFFILIALVLFANGNDLYRYFFG
jgi:regulator of sigma E protease